MWLCSRLKQWPVHFSLLFSWKVSTGFMCVSFLMSSFLMCSNLVVLLAHSTSSFLLKLTLLSESHLSFYGPIFITVCHCWSGDCFEDVVFQFHGHLPIAHHPGYFLPLHPHDSDHIVDISLWTCLAHEQGPEVFLGCYCRQFSINNFNGGFCFIWGLGKYSVFVLLIFSPFLSHTIIHVSRSSSTSARVIAHSDKKVTYLIIITDNV